MHNLLTALWKDERGFLVSSELIIISTILVLGLIVGLTTLQNALVYEFQDLAFAFSSLNQSFAFPGFFGCRGSFHPGSFFFSPVNRFCPLVSTGVGGFGGGYGGFGGFGGADIGFGGGANYGYGGMAVPGPIVAPAPCPTGNCDTCPNGDCGPGAVLGNDALQPVPMTVPDALPQAEPKPETLQAPPRS